MDRQQIQADYDSRLCSQAKGMVEQFGITVVSSTMSEDESVLVLIEGSGNLDFWTHYHKGAFTIARTPIVVRPVPST